MKNILIHGLGQNNHSWDNTVAYLNKKGIPFLIHHASSSQLRYEEDILRTYDPSDIIGHYRIS